MNLATLGTVHFEGFSIDIVDSVQDYVSLMKSIFDFDFIKHFLSNNKQFKILFDAMHGVTGPYAYALFVKEFGLSPECLMNYKPLEDFGGGHPDPNLTVSFFFKKSFFFLKKKIFLIF